MNPIRRTVLIVAIIQILVACIWFILILANPNSKTGTIINLFGLLGCGVLGLIAQKDGDMIRTAITLNWILVVLWSIGLIRVFSAFIGIPELYGALTIITVTTMAIIIPCAVNGVCLVMLPNQRY